MTLVSTVSAPQPASSKTAAPAGRGIANTAANTRAPAIVLHPFMTPPPPGPHEARALLTSSRELALHSAPHARRARSIPRLRARRPRPRLRLQLPRPADPLDPRRAHQGGPRPHRRADRLPLRDGLRRLLRDLRHPARPAG